MGSIFLIDHQLVSNKKMSNTLAPLFVPLLLGPQEAVLSAAKLADLEKVVQELQKPKPTFWQKIFGQQES